MATWNKKLHALTNDELECISVRYLMGWHDLSQYGFRLRGLNSLRIQRGLDPLDKAMSDEYRLSYIRNHFTKSEIKDCITTYLLNHRVGDERWVGIELLNCRFGREYARLFKELLGSAEYRSLSEKYRVKKLMDTQLQNGGIGLQNPVAQSKAVVTNLQRYGVKNSMQRTDIHVVSPFTRSEVRKKSNHHKSLNLQDAMKIYKQTGVIDDVKKRMSQVEFVVFDMLLAKFGKDDVFYSYGLHPYDARYPFNCDFYIKSLDLFIELNVHYSHGSHWYDATNHDDKLRVQHLLQSDSKKSHNAIHVWTVTDVQKCECARRHNLRYLVFWDAKQYHYKKQKYYRLSDFHEWYDTFDCDYDTFIKLHPENTYFNSLESDQVIETVSDMRMQDMIVTDPKGELLRNSHVSQDYQISQIDLTDTMTDFYNPSEFIAKAVYDTFDCDSDEIGELHTKNTY